MNACDDRALLASIPNPTQMLMKTYLAHRACPDPASHASVQPAGLDMKEDSIRKSARIPNAVRDLKSPLLHPPCPPPKLASGLNSSKTHLTPSIPAQATGPLLR